MEHPLVNNAQGFVLLLIEREGVLGENVETEGGDKLGYAVIYLGVDVVRTACEHYSSPALSLHKTENSASLSADIVLDSALFSPRLLCCGANLLSGNAPSLTAELNEPVLGGLFARERDERAQVFDLAAGYRLDVVFEVFGVGYDHRAVVVILRALRLLIFVEYAGVENGLDAGSVQPLNVAVRELRGVALALRGDGLHSCLVELPAGER